MNRENKFRVWHKKEHRWITSNVYLSPDGLLWWIAGYQTNGPELLDDEQVAVCFSTGLKDKNGKEIFEGAVLQHDLWGLTEVIWEQGMFRGTETESGKDITLADHQLSRSRVIGNVFENPKLMQAKAA